MDWRLPISWYEIIFPGKSYKNKGLIHVVCVVFKSLAFLCSKQEHIFLISIIVCFHIDQTIFQYEKKSVIAFQFIYQIQKINDVLAIFA